MQWSRYTALLFAVGLGIGEAVINWGHWQFAPLWIGLMLVIAALGVVTSFQALRKSKL